MIDELLKKIEKLLPDGLKRFQCPENLYHYCGPKSFSKIIETKTIHLSDATCSNDYAEFCYGDHLTTNVLKKYREKNNISSVKNENLKTLLECYNLSRPLHSPFFLCLSEDANLLSQWRGYASNASGFVIGFNTKVLKEKIGVQLHRQTGANIVPRQSPKILDRVIYNRKLQEHLIELCFEISLTANYDQECSLKIYELPLSIYPPAIIYSGNPQSLTTGEIFNPNNCLSAAHNLLHLSKIFKHEGFGEEREWRIIATPNRLVAPNLTHSLKDLYPDFKTINGRIVPFLKIDIPSDLIEFVSLGPKNSNSPEMVQWFLEKNGFQNVRVKRSWIPYR